MNHKKKLFALCFSVVLSLSVFQAASATTGATECAKPGDFTLTAAPGDHTMALNWTPSAGADSYDVFYSPRAPFAATDLQTTSFTVTNLRNGYIGYSFGIIAKNACGSTWSNTINQVATSATGAPAKPSISINDNDLYTEGKFTVRWDIWHGNVATAGRIFENGIEVQQNIYEEIPNVLGQTSSFYFTRSPGTYTYQIELSNPFGTVLSDPITVIVP